MATAAAADADHARELVARYQGTWEADIQSVDSAWSKAGTQRWTIDNWCTPVREFYTCRQRFNDAPPTLTVYSFAQAGGRHSSVLLGLDGKVLQSGPLTAQGETLTFPWEVVDSDGTRTYFRILNAWRGPDCIDFRKEFSTDGASWHLIASDRERRAGVPPVRGSCGQ
ncbi:hypothetical protein ACPWT1_07820 [Ramlibacter sp. MMS24-I3-19]|uniref:hypothetical protein n=1 Tax=Ramlibacter sp. MMS24-I3-19 TaxID=3416606 RepID=UPI003D04292F